MGLPAVENGRAKQKDEGYVNTLVIGRQTNAGLASVAREARLAHPSRRNKTRLTLRGPIT